MSFIKRDKLGRFVKGNQINLGRKCPSEKRMKISLANKGRLLNGLFDENHPSWKGDDVKYRALHQWLNKRLPKPKFCQICVLKPPRHLANMTGVYNRDFKNWKYLCQFCHMKYDGTITNLKQYRSIPK